MPTAQLVDKRTTDEITPYPLRAPETVLNGPWNQKVDVWTFGCLVSHISPSVGLATDSKIP